jgi:adenine-specific DNA methylase
MTQKRTTEERSELPIEAGFPIEHVNEIADREARGIAKRYYRPIYTMHKWWARRLGCVFRTISLYSLVDNPENIEVYEPGKNTSLSDFSASEGQLSSLIDGVSMDNPDSLWQLYSKDVRVKDKKVLDPFMGGGTSLVESSRFAAEVTGHDLNPVSWFICKKELDTHQTTPDELQEAFSKISDKVEEEIKKYYKTSCSNGDHKAEVTCFQWVKQLDCTSCDNTVSLFDDYRVAKGRYDHDGEQLVYCPHCTEVTYVDDWRSECTCGKCGSGFNPSQGNVGGNGRKYTCPDCGLKYGITDAVEEQEGYKHQLYALEYYCETCAESQSMDKGDYKGYKAVNQEDRDLYSDAVQEWESRDDLQKYVPDYEIRPGWKTASSEFEGTAPGAGNLSLHNISDWTDMFNERQLLSLSKLLRAIESIDDQIIREYLLLSFSDSLRGNTMMVNYQVGSNAITNLFKSNSFDPPKRPAENNLWGAEEGARNFTRSFERMIEGVKYGSEPFDRYPDEDGEFIKSPPFGQPVGVNSKVSQQDVRDLEIENEYDAVITDPPYYHNVIYSELSDFFYVWQRALLKKEYNCFEPLHTPRAESIVSNPAEQKGVEEFETELHNAFERIHKALKEDGILTFTYHHSDSESWGELLEALCDVGFEITAAYPVTADLDKLEEGESVSFDIIVVARPAQNRQSISWNALRREIYRTARRTRKRLEENRDLSRGDIGVMEMGECFREYSKYHGKVQRDGEIMSAKEVVKEIYGIIQEASDIGVEEVFIDLLDTQNPTYDDVNKLCRGTNAKPEDLREMYLYNQENGFELGVWNNEKRQAYIQERVNGDGGKHLSNLDKLQFLRFRYEKGQAVQNYVEKWEVDDDLRELAGRLADVTGDDTYTRVLGDRDITNY